VEQFFASLSKRQTMLLLTSLAFGGSDAIGSYEHLSVDEEELLKHRAQSLLQIPRDKRIPLVIQEIKRLVTARRRQLANADPKRLAALLSKERGALIEVVLRALPSELADACRAELGPRPTVKLAREVRPDILSIVRWKLEEGLKRGAPQVGTFRFTDLIMMPPREILSICDRMGARVLATTVAGLGDSERDEFLAKLPPDQRSLAAKAAEAGRARRLTEGDAKTVLEIHGALENPSVGLRSAGAQRVMRAAVAQGPEFAQRLTERHAGHELGKLLIRWFKEEKARSVKGDGGRLDIVEQMERLAQKGVIDRPLRLPPPMRPPGSPPLGGPPMLQPIPIPQGRGRSQPFPAVRPESGSRVGPPPGKEAPAQGSRIGPPPEAPARGPRAPAGTPQAPRRDPIAERNARRAGVMSSRPAPPALGAQDAQGSGVRRIMRDGKPLVRDPSDTQPPPKRPRRAVTSPAVQELPRRKGPTGSETGGARSPVLKGSSGRGPGGRSG
jgi:flagellar motor switch protein FliG